MTIQPRQAAPDFEQDSTAGTVSLYGYLGSNKGMPFSHPSDLNSVRNNVATPVNRTDSRPVMIASSLPDAESKARFPGAWKPLKPYLRVVEQPKLPHEAA